MSIVNSKEVRLLSPQRKYCGIRFGALLIVIFIMAWVTAANALVDLKDYEGLKNDGTFQIYISGVAEGYLFGNLALREFRGQKPFFCPPKKLALNSKNYISIIDNAITKYDLKVGPVEIVPLQALGEVFPCE